MSKENAAVLKAKMVAAAILGMAKQAYAKTAEAAVKAGRKARRGGRSAYYRRPADFYTHGSRTFLKNKRRGF